MIFGHFYIHIGHILYTFFEYKIWTKIDFHKKIFVYKIYTVYIWLHCIKTVYKKAVTKYIQKCYILYTFYIHNLLNNIQ